jgi:prepilin-type N-terminal cleavage/methylation domain-containing protein
MTKHLQSRARTKPNGRTATAFTLIELLIVVAIIAILAAIAVPNFLEAQTRSKISRVKSDLRTLATALESYYVDYNSYTCRNTEGENPYLPNTDPYPYWTGFRMLTTPVGYITSLPRDPFGATRAALTAPRGAAYGLGTGRASDRRATLRTDAADPRLPADCWMVESDGPDRWDDTNGGIIASSRFPWPTLSANDLTANTGAITAANQPVPIPALFYDPTNGTLSNGEILRFGGIKPEGETYSFLWSTSGL